MAKASLVLDARTPNREGKFPLKISVSSKGATAYVSTGLALSASEWDDRHKRISDKHPRWRTLRPYTQSLLLSAQSVTLAKGELRLKELTQEIRAALFPDRHTPKSEKRKPGILSVLRMMADKSSPSSKLVYERTLRHVHRFCGGVDADMDSVTPGWLESFDKDLARFSPSPNSRAIHMRNLRAAFNWAIGEGLASSYPFRRFKIKTVGTAKRALSPQDMKKVSLSATEEWMQRYVDFFMLSFCLIGINPKDLLLLPKTSFRDGRIEYSRAKTRKLYSVKVEPEAKEIINRHRGQGSRLLDFLPEGADYIQFVRQADHALKSLGTNMKPGCRREGEPLFPNLSMYWARHSWATIAASLDVPKSTISKALGHSEGLAVTEVYIDFDMGKVDAANRRVLDCVFGAKEGEA